MTSRLPKNQFTPFYPLQLNSEVCWSPRPEDSAEPPNSEFMPPQFRGPGGGDCGKCPLCAITTGGKIYHFRSCPRLYRLTPHLSASYQESCNKIHGEYFTWHVGIKYRNSIIYWCWNSMVDKIITNKISRNSGRQRFGTVITILRGDSLGIWIPAPFVSDIYGASKLNLICKFAKWQIGWKMNWRVWLSIVLFLYHAVAAKVGSLALVCLPLDWTMPCCCQNCSFWDWDSWTFAFG